MDIQETSVTWLSVRLTGKTSNCGSIKWPNILLNETSLFFIFILSLSIVTYTFLHKRITQLTNYNFRAELIGQIALLMPKRGRPFFFYPVEHLERRFYICYTLFIYILFIYTFLRVNLYQNKGEREKYSYFFPFYAISCETNSFFEIRISLPHPK